jgi:hypothetical protein
MKELLTFAFGNPAFLAAPVQTAFANRLSRERRSYLMVEPLAIDFDVQVGRPSL